MNGGVCNGVSSKKKTLLLQEIGVEIADEIMTELSSRCGGLVRLFAILV